MSDPFRPRTWNLSTGRSLTLGPTSVLMGIVNVTPDSFSDGGKFDRVDEAVAHAHRMIEEGAHIIDVGGESTRPGAQPVSEIEEQDRVLPVIEALAQDKNILLSIDTYRSTTAEAAVNAGAHIINDVWGFQKDHNLAGVAAKTGAGVCAMHTGRERERKSDVIVDQIGFLKGSLQVLRQAGVNDHSIVLDPGFGFAKNPGENIELLSRLEELNGLGYPLLIGTSRKRFIGQYTGRDAHDRDIGTAATSVVARMKGGAIFRVHDIPANRDALVMADALISAGKKGN